MSNKYDLREVPLTSVRENQVALRGVDKEDEKYISMRDSVKQQGFINPISVREKNDEKGTPYYEIVDGLHRYSCALDLGLETIPVNVRTTDDIATLESQIVANLARVDTKPVEFTKALQRLLVMNPTMTKADLAERVSQSPAWIDQRLGLLKLLPDIQTAVDNGDIGISNAAALSKLPKDEQLNFLDAAMAQNSAEFVPAINNRIKELRAAARSGKAADEASFQPVSHLRSKKDAESEMDKPSVGPAMCSAEGVTTAAAGFALAVKWFLNRDKDSEATQKAKYEQRKKEVAEAKARRDVEKADKAAKDAADKAAEVKAKVGVTA